MISIILYIMQNVISVHTQKHTWHSVDIHSTPKMYKKFELQVFNRHSEIWGQSQDSGLFLETSA